MEKAEIETLIAASILPVRLEYDAKLAESEKKLNSAQAQLRKLSEPKVEVEIEKEPKSTAKKSAADIELDARLAKIEAREKRTATTTKRNEVVAHFTSIGLTGDALTDAVDLFIVRNDGKIQFDDETGEVRFKSSEIDEPEAFGEWFKKADGAGKFKSIKPSKQLPTKGISQNSGTDKVVNENEPSRGDLMSGKVSRDALRLLAVAEQV